MTFCSLRSGIWRFRVFFHKPSGRSRGACSVIDAVLVNVLLFHGVPAQAWACMCSFILERPRASHVSPLLVQSGLGLAAGDHTAEQGEMQACSVSPPWITAVDWMRVSLNLLIVFFQLFSCNRHYRFSEHFAPVHSRLCCKGNVGQPHTRKKSHVISCDDPMWLSAEIFRGAVRTSCSKARFSLKGVKSITIITEFGQCIAAVLWGRGNVGEFKAIDWQRSNASVQPCCHPE